MLHKFMKLLRENPNELKVFVEEIPTDNRELIVFVPERKYLRFQYDSHDSVLYISSINSKAVPVEIEVDNEGGTCIAGHLTDEDVDLILKWYRSRVF